MMTVMSESIRALTIRRVITVLYTHDKTGRYRVVYLILLQI
jgi:hypothetical protein